jgi:hypothetical protein
VLDRPIWAIAGRISLLSVLSTFEDLASVGDIDFLYETSLLVDDAEQATAHVAKLLALDANNFVAINPTRFEYAGYLTLFTAGMMLGLSRRTQAWTWSGSLERVQPFKKNEILISVSLVCDRHLVMPATLYES